jgi:Tfp pilus assembly protein PilO
MKEIINLLSRTDRRAVIALGLAIMLGLILYASVFLPKRTSYLSRQRQIDRQQQELQRLEAQRLEQKTMLADWIQAQEEVQEVKSQYFYSRETGYQSVRQDLNHIFQATGIQAERIRYDYAEVRDADIQKMIIHFEVSGTYDRLKGFLFEIETFPKFILVEKIDFRNTKEASRNITLSLTLAAYHAL